MFKTIFDDLTYLPRRKFSAKYVLPVIIFVFAYGLLGQVITLLTPLQYLGKASGSIADIQTKVISWSRGRYSTHSTPNYALAITLDNEQTYNIQEEAARIKLGPALKSGDHITIYYPTLTQKILTAAIIRDVSQVEKGGTILYSWDQQRKEGWLLIPFFVLAISVFSWLRKYQLNYMDSSTLK